MNPRISMITLGVNDLPRAMKFFEEGVGYSRMNSPAEVAFFTLNGTLLGVYGRAALAKDACMKAVDAFMQQPAKVGDTIVNSEEKTFRGGCSGYSKAPDGLHWESAHDPFFWIGPKDMNTPTL